MNQYKITLYVIAVVGTLTCVSTVIKWIFPSYNFKIGVKVSYMSESIDGKYETLGTHSMKSWETEHVISLSEKLTGKDKQRAFYHEFGHLVQNSMLPGITDNYCYEEFFAESFAHYCMGRSLEYSYVAAEQYLNQHPKIDKIDRQKVKMAKQLLEIVIDDETFINAAKDQWSKL